MMISTVYSFLPALLLPTVVTGDGLPYIISDHRVQDLDTTPYLGRGYSIMTNSFHSICLTVEQTTVPSYNYDYSFSDFTSSKFVEQEVNEKLTGSMALSAMTKKLTQDTNTVTKTNTNTKYITSSMRIERYYSSVREDEATLSDDAVTLLDRQDYIGFFIACGPTFIRGTRRFQEVVTIFSFQSNNVEKTQEIATTIVTSTWKNKVYTKVRRKKKCKIFGFFICRKVSERTRVNYIADLQTAVENSVQRSRTTTEEKTLKIDIKGYGLGLNHEGSESMVATSLLDYNEVMKFAFNGMTRVHGYAHIGMVYGVEVVNWVENVNFQSAANIQDEVITIPLPLSLIPRSFSYNVDHSKNYDYVGATEAQKLDFSCKDPAAVIDKYGYCCESESLYDPVEKEYNSETPNERVCRTLRTMDPVYLKENMSANAEFVSRLEQVFRYKVDQINTLERCISAFVALPKRYDYHFLKPNQRVKYDGTFMPKTTLKEMRLALDPFDDFSLVTIMAKELDEYTEMFVQPCYAALFGANIGTTPDTDVSYFSAYPWYHHAACSKLSCLGAGMRWNRDSSVNGGCVGGFATGLNTMDYDTTDTNSNCSKELMPENPQAITVQCKYTSETMNTHVQQYKKVWGTLDGVTRADNYVEQFCMPELEHEQLSGTKREMLAAKELAVREWYKTQLDPTHVPQYTMLSSNIAYKKSTSSSGTYGWRYYSFRAVDGNRDGHSWRNSLFHSRNNNNEWWQVDLGRDYDVKEVHVYNRQDCCDLILASAKVTLLSSSRATIAEMSISEAPEYFNKLDFGTAQSSVRFVRVTGSAGQYLQLAEVEVYAELNTEVFLSE